MRQISSQCEQNCRPRAVNPGVWKGGMYAGRMYTREAGALRSARSERRALRPQAECSLRAV